MPTVLVLFLSMALVIALIVWVRLHPFLALLIGGVAVALATPSIPAAGAAAAVATEFGVVCGRIGIIIALASFIGIGLHRSGGAARIGAAFLALAGPRRAHLSMWASGYVLSVPVFFDTVFYLLQPLARAMHVRARRGYTLNLMGIMAGGAATHVFVPPTPGPLAAASQLGVDLGLMIPIGAFVGLMGSLGGVLYSQWAVRRWPDAAAVARATFEREADEAAASSAHVAGAEARASEGASALPSLWLSLLPIVLPVMLISGSTAATAAKLSGPVPRMLAFLLASLLKFAQGSSTVAIITTASVLQATYVAGATGLPHPVYAALAASGGALVGSWMNDSGFWVIGKMGRLTEGETIRLWSSTAAVVGTVGFITVLVLQALVPLR